MQLLCCNFVTSDQFYILYSQNLHYAFHILMRKYYAQITNKYVNDLLSSFCVATQNKSVILCQHWLLHKTSSQSLYLSNRSFNFFDKIADEMRNMFPFEINWLVYSSSDEYNLDIIIKLLNPKRVFISIVYGDSLLWTHCKQHS